ncbi:MAG: phosphatidylserine decarboxylase [Eubacterium sp.]|nr:phosphatidylserine decarboxylase [Eubacterium sp.]
MVRLTADRRGKLEKTGSMQDCLLGLLYGTKAGRMLVKPLAAPQISKMGAWLLDTRASSCLVPLFIRSHSIPMEDFAKVRYRSFNDFFTRKLAEGARGVAPEPEVFVSPCDGRLCVYKVDEACSFVVKHTRYTVESLLKNRRLAGRFAGGYAWVFRLCVDDYHRYCYVDDGVVSKQRRIAGVLHTVNPVANDVYPIYKENAREYCLLKTEHFKTVLQMEVGAMFVGRIENVPGERAVRRGEEKGHFAFGGSTVIVLTQKKAVLPDGDLLRYTKSGVETKVRLGEQVGIQWGDRKKTAGS